MVVLDTFLETPIGLIGFRRIYELEFYPDVSIDQEYFKYLIERYRDYPYNVTLYLEATKKMVWSECE